MPTQEYKDGRNTKNYRSGKVTELGIRARHAEEVLYRPTKWDLYLRGQGLTEAQALAAPSLVAQWVRAHGSSVFVPESILGALGFEA